MTPSLSTPVTHLSATQGKTYLLATVFTAGNILLPQLCHLIPGGGLISCRYISSRSLRHIVSGSPQACLRPFSRQFSTI